MPKAILELEMPESCVDCPLRFDGLIEHYCAITWNVTDLYTVERRPDCPLIDKEEYLKEVKICIK